jgi:hypothetical protein
MRILRRFLIRGIDGLVMLIKFRQGIGCYSCLIGDVKVVLL